MTLSDEDWTAISNESPDLTSKVLTVAAAELRSAVKILKRYDINNENIRILSDRLERVLQLKAERFPPKAKRMVFSKAIPQLLDGSMTVTRRTGWLSLRVGDELVAVESWIGLKKGEKQVVIGRIVITDVRRERLDAIDDDDCIREGFSNMNCSEFIDMFCETTKCEPHDMVTRIEFRKLPDDSLEVEL